ncbi:Spo0B domain-containing protein, partial [Mammaliicoccus sciuri]|uniref:Spo0B domain-containing protein n=1 Tax=Mammaliicoccus sciuri TaxID=1296 RepID=UPI001F54741C
NKGDGMYNLDVYLKSTHDFVNQLQMLFTYKQLGKHEEVDLLIDELYKNLKQEQLFLNAPRRKFVHNVFEYKLSLSGSKWTFEIDNSNIDYYQKNLERTDNTLTNIFNDLKYVVINDMDEKNIHISLTVEEEFVTMLVWLSATNQDLNQIEQSFSKYNVEVLSESQNHIELEFFINIKEIEV